MSCSCGCDKRSHAKEWSTTPMFSELKRGDKVKIVGYRTGDSQYKSKLLSMGLVRGVELRVLQVAPLVIRWKWRYFRTGFLSARKKQTF